MIKVNKSNFTKHVYTTAHQKHYQSISVKKKSSDLFLIINIHWKYDWNRKSKRIEGARAICNSNPQVGDPVPTLIGYWISGNSVGNINTAKSLK